MVEDCLDEASPFSVSNPSSVHGVYVSFAAKICMLFCGSKAVFTQGFVPVDCLSFDSPSEVRREVLLVRLVFQVYGCTSLFGRKLVSYSRCVDQEAVSLVEL
ncbi:Uncharacterized protein Rs2_39616 [Raphanus sativus]|nr:Uncharacterized protein Rs2_39616 [Raphanus sativus]